MLVFMKDIIDYQNSVVVNNNIIKFTIRNDVKMIPNGAFSYDPELFGGSVHSRDLLTAVEIPSSVEEIGFGAFCGCSHLEILLMPGSIKSIGADCFEGANRLHMIFIDTKEKTEFERVKSLLPAHLQSKAIFGKGLLNTICEMRIKASKVFESNFFPFQNQEKRRFINMIEAVPLPPYDGDQDKFKSLYQDHLNHFSRRWWLAHNLISYFQPLGHFQIIPFFNNMLEKITAYKEPLDLSVEEIIFIAQKQKILLSFFDYRDSFFIDNETNGNQKWEEWLTSSDNFKKCFNHPRLKELMHFLTDPQWNKEKIDLLKYTRKIDGLFNQEKPIEWIILQSLSHIENRVFLFSKEMNKYILDISSLVAAFIELDISYKKETILTIQDPNILLRNLRALKVMADKCTPQESGRPEMIFLRKLKGIDMNEIPPLLWRKHLSYTEEECLEFNQYIEENHQKKHFSKKR